MQAEGTFNLGTLMGHPPITDEQEAARYITQYFRFPADGTFSFFEFAPGLNKQKYARYEYKDKAGKSQVAYFSQGIVDKTFEGYRTSHARNAKILNVYASLANLAGAGVLVGAEMKAATGEFKAAAASQTASLTPLESKIVNQSKSILNSKSFATIRTAYEKGLSAEVDINGTKVLYNPEWTYSEAMTLQQEGGFMLGPKAFTAKGGIEQTVAWEVTRLNTQNTGSLGVDQTKSFTQSAQQMSEKLLPHIKKHN